MSRDTELHPSLFGRGCRLQGAVPRRARLSLCAGDPWKGRRLGEAVAALFGASPILRSPRGSRQARR